MDTLFTIYSVNTKNFDGMLYYATIEEALDFVRDQVKMDFFCTVRRDRVGAPEYDKMLASMEAKLPRYAAKGTLMDNEPLFTVVETSPDGFKTWKYAGVHQFGTPYEFFEQAEWGDTLKDSGGQILYVNQCSSCGRKFLYGMLILIEYDCSDCRGK